MKYTKLSQLFSILIFSLAASCSKNSPDKDIPSSSTSGIFKMIITTSGPQIDSQKSSVGLIFAGVGNGLPVKCAANYSRPEDDNVSIDEDTIAKYGSPITVTSLKPVETMEVSVAYWGVQTPAPLSLNLAAYIDDKKIFEDKLSLTSKEKAISYIFKGDGTTTTYDVDVSQLSKHKSNE